MSNDTQFDTTFRALIGHDPFPWQRGLFERMVQGDVPRSCDIPTGLGKTAAVAVWLIALTHCPDKLPRRLVYVVNRRTVVDQTTDEVEKLRRNLKAAGLWGHLKNLCAMKQHEAEPPLAISTLRGQFADNREWSADPARPAVIVGTVDMIGSRLLFSGYGVGFKGRPLHAGFLGQDVLLVHDEAHLEPAFQRLVTGIRQEQERCKEFRSFRVMVLTATSREQEATNADNGFALTDEEKNPPAVIPDPPTEPIHHLWRRVKAHKTIHLHPVGDEKKELADKITELALRFEDSKRPILVFSRTVETVEKIVNTLEKKRQQVRQLTGTTRGLERDRLVDDPAFQRFLPQAVPGDQTVYLVCTSAGEVGVNITGDHLVCDLTTFESMAQRFGRVNRFGECTDTKIHVVHPEEFDGKDPYERARQKTLDLLQQLNGDGSPAALGKFAPAARAVAFSPEPTFLPATDILFDSWALTTIRDRLPGRPPVEPYLHGVAEWEPPETYVAWRQEVCVITGELLQQYKPDELLEDYPLKPHELLRDRSDRVFKHVAAIGARHPNDPIWLVDEVGHVEVLTLQELANKDNKNRINYRTVLLPPSVGGLSKSGTLGGNADHDDAEQYDVADEWFADDDKTVRRRVRVWDDDPVPAGMRLIRTIDTRPDAEETEEESETPARRYWHWYELPETGESEGSQSASRPVPWQTHTEDVVVNIQAIADTLRLPAELKTALSLAAKFHDLGKKRERWQRSIGNPNPRDWLAKSGGGMKPRDICPDYRHEFGSLLDAQADPEFQKLADHLKDLVLHLVAAGHGRARPHFPANEVFDLDRTQREAEAMAAEVPRRFARLQRKYGRWGLAYLESLLRAADYAASASPSVFADETPAQTEVMS